MHESWRQSFYQFRDDLQREIGPRPSKEYSLDRVDNSRGYEPGNVRWATVPEQATNRSKHSFLTCQGTTLTMSRWAQRTGLSSAVISGRIRLGWPSEEVLGIKPHFLRI